MLNLLFLKGDNLSKLLTLKLEIPTLYETDLVNLTETFKKNSEELKNLTQLSFKGVQFRSFSINKDTFEIRKLPLHDIFKLPSLDNLNLNGTNFIHCLNKEDFELFVTELKAKDKMSYLGLANILTISKNIGRYSTLLQNLPAKIIKLNISNNLIIPDAFINYLAFTVDHLKMTFASC